MASGEKTVFVEQLQDGQQVEDVFLVARKNLAETKAGKPYLALSLMDRTGEIEARVWDNAPVFDPRAAVGNYVRIRGTAKLFRDQLQLGVVHLEQVEAAGVSPADFMPASRRTKEDMQAELAEIIAMVAHPGLRGLLETVFSGETLEQFSTAPAAKKMHHAYLGGLLEHTLSVTGLAMKLAEQYPGLDRDILMTGALLHDLAKIQEFSFAAPPFDYTDQGRLMGHLVLGVDMVRRAARGIEQLDDRLLDQVCHLILSHHGRHEFGAPVLPMTQEALLLHHADDIDAKMNYTDQLREKMTEPGWTDYQRPLERFLYLQPLSDPVDRDAAPRKPIRTGGKKVEKKPDELLKRQQTLF
jgi:3'-5' exoribonuclease